ncbi:MAG TPA: hypothetical protein VN442_15795 [Bryobacteraceae bacterium]|nr:hypothetical protein [Bryobacteraceae bacterium]
MKPAAARRSSLRLRLNAAVSIFLFFGCAAFAGVGATVVFIDPTRPRVVGAIVMIIATAIGIATVGTWRRVLPAVFACGALNGSIITAQGHALNAPGTPVARPMGLVLTLAMLAAAVLTAKANDRSFKAMERLSFIGIFLSCALLFSSFDMQPAAMLGAICCASIPMLRDLLTHKG